MATARDNLGPRRKILMLTTLLVSGYILLCALLYVGQRQLLYFPQAMAEGDRANVITLEVPGAILGVSARRIETAEAIIYFGGNADDVSTALAPFSRAFPSHALYLMHYRGYGASNGRPTEALLHQDAAALYDYVADRHSRITVIGRSLGSGVAIRLVRQRAVDRLVLLTPYDSVTAVAARRFPFVPVGWLIKDRFASVLHAPHIDVPTLVLKSAQDAVIPHPHTDRLIEHFDQSLLAAHTIAATSHNTILESARTFELLQDFLAAQPATDQQ